MKKISIICLILGAVLLIGGIGVRLAVDNNENTKELNEIASKIDFNNKSIVVLKRK